MNVLPSMKTDTPRFLPGFFLTALENKWLSICLPCGLAMNLYMAFPLAYLICFSICFNRPEIPSGDWSSLIFSITNFFKFTSIATFKQSLLDSCLFTYALCSAFFAVYLPLTLLFLISSLTLLTLRSSAQAIQRKLFPFLKNFSIF